MRVLYLSPWHGRLEYDELRTFTELGHTWLSTGFYADPRSPIDSVHRCEMPPLDVDADFTLPLFQQINRSPTPHQFVRITKELADHFDVVICSHCCPAPEILFGNEDGLQNKPIIWRTYCQQKERDEAMASVWKNRHKLFLVRGSPRERKVRGCAGVDYVVRPCVDEEFFDGWIGGGGVLTFENFYNRRQAVSNTTIYERVIKGLPVAVFGAESDGAPNYGGMLDSASQRLAYQTCGAYFALGSKPASCTYNLVEAMMTGCPVVTWDASLGDDGSGTYEVPDLFKHEEHLFLINEQNARHFLDYVLTNQDEVRKMGVRGRARALTHFSREANRRSWEEAICLATK